MEQKVGNCCDDSDNMNKRENDELSTDVDVGLGPIDKVSWNANKKQK